MAEKGKPVSRTQQVAPENRFTRFYRETLAELRKVVWPTREQAINLTIIVVIVVTAMSIFLGAIDALMTEALKAILSH